jgi:CheY-like chemotaxis protein
MQQAKVIQPWLRGIALSGFGMEEDLARSRAAGFASHLTKPINAHALDGALNRLLQSTARPPSEERSTVARRPD